MAETFSIGSVHPVHDTSDLGPAGDKDDAYVAPPKDSQAPATAGGGGTEPMDSERPRQEPSAPKGGSTNPPH